MSKIKENIVSAEILLPNKNLTQTIDFFTIDLGFQLTMIFPADNPKTAVMEGHGLKIRLTDNINEAGTIILNHKLISTYQNMIAPNGTKIVFHSQNKLAIPENIQKYTFSKYSNNDNWIRGRAGMLYRDLIPGRQNGRFIASHIKIEKGGIVSDYTHYHNIRFQFIYCLKGWVKVVYEDQRPPMIMKAGDCFLQPPHIRHQVLESSDGLEVLEVGCPADHETFTDIKLQLPNVPIKKDRLFSNQLFVFFQYTASIWIDWRIHGFEANNTGIDHATNDLISVLRVRPKTSFETPLMNHSEEFLFIYILCGQLKLKWENEAAESFQTNDSFTIPEKLNHSFSCSEDLEFIEVRLSGKFENVMINH